MDIGVLGPLQVVHDGAPVPVAGARAAALLLRLLLDRGRPVPHERLVDAVWGLQQPHDPANALQAQISRLRRTFADAGLRDVLRTVAGGYLIDVPRDAVDAERFSDAVGEGRRRLQEGAAGEAAQTLAAALGCWRGPPAWAGIDDDAAQAEARRLEQLRAAAERDHVDARLAAGRHDEVLPWLEAAVRDAPFDERLHGQLMTALYRSARQSDALEVFTRLRHRLDAELGLEPGPQVQAIQSAILGHADDLRVPAAVGPAARPQLPRVDTSFIGRARELEDVRAALSSARIVTLVGPGGAGKTRLAVEVARGEELAADVRFASLAAAGDETAVFDEVIAVLGGGMISSTAGELTTAVSTLDRIARLVRGRRLLVVLDNCEHVPDAAARVADRLLEASGELRILATSRERLRVPGEQAVPVAPLQVPSDTDTSPRQVVASDAVALFVDRARAVQADFRLDARTAASVSAICRRLDGLPLAIELAAARIGSLPPDLLAARLGDRFQLLTGGSRVAARRQQTLEAVVEWSYDLLDAPQRTVFLRLGVFAGSFDVEAVEAVVAPPDGDDGGLQAGAVLSLLSELVDKSLVRPVATAPTARWSMLETLRDFALRRLVQTSDAAAVRTRHARWYAQLAARAAPGVRGPEQVAWLELLTREQDNFLGALAWLADDDPPAATRLAVDLSWFWWLRGHHTAAVHWLDAVARGGAPDDLRQVATVFSSFHAVFTGVDPAGMLARTRAALDLLGAAVTRDAAEALVAGAYVLLAGGDRAGAATQIDRAEKAATASAHAWVRATIPFLRANLRMMQGDLPGAMASAEEAVGRARAIGDRWGEYQNLDWLAGAATVLGRYGEAHARVDRAEVLAAELGMRDQQVSLQARRGFLALLGGELDEAAVTLTAAARTAEAERLRTATIMAHTALGDLARRRGDPAGAAAAYRTVLATGNGEPAVEAEALAGLVLTAAMTGDSGAADGLLADAVARLREAPVPGTTVPLVLEAGAAAATLQGDAELAARRLGCATALREAAGRPLVGGERHDVDRLSHALRGALDAERFAAAWQTGVATPPEALLG